MCIYNLNYIDLIDCKSNNMLSVITITYFEVWPIFLILNVVSALEGTL